MNEEDLICPYCGRVQDCHEPDDISSLMCHTECEHCGKPFWYSVDVTREYSPYKDEDENDDIVSRKGRERPAESEEKAWRD